MNQLDKKSELLKQGDNEITRWSRETRESKMEKRKG